MVQDPKGLEEPKVVQDPKGLQEPKVVQDPKGLQEPKVSSWETAEVDRAVYCSSANSLVKNSFPLACLAPMEETDIFVPWDLHWEMPWLRRSVVLKAIRELGCSSWLYSG